MEETFLGMGSTFWQFVNGGLSTLIIGVCMGIVSSRWLDKREQINAEEGAMLDRRVDAYMELLDFMAELENKKILMDPDFSLRNDLKREGLRISRDRPAVEYWPMLEDFEVFEACFRKLDHFYQQNLALMDPKAAKELIFTYGMFGRIYGYYMYLSTVQMPDGTYLTHEEVRQLLNGFYPKLGMALDEDLTQMQTKLERTVMDGVYRLRFIWNRRLITTKKAGKYFEKRYLKTDFFTMEEELFAVLRNDLCVLRNIPLDQGREVFLPNGYVDCACGEVYVQ